MSEKNDRRQDKLPVTAEVGSEGGSFADPTVQVATFEGDVARRTGHGGAGSMAHQATRRSEVVTGGADDAPAAAEGIVRYPTEPVSPPSATRGRRMTGLDWRVGLAGAAAGAAVAMAVSRMRRGRNAQQQQPEPRGRGTSPVGRRPSHVSRPTP